MSKSTRSGQLVVPGQKLGVIEEFLSDSGTYIEEGVIYSDSIGLILKDFSEKTVSVYPIVQKLKTPIVGNLIVGQISNVQRSQAIIQIREIEEKPLNGYFSGLLHISDVSFKYTENMTDYFRLGDIVRAKVISCKNMTYHLSTKGDNLGVLKAFCSRCGGLLVLKRKKIKCENCNHIENRKVTSDYSYIGT